GVAFRAHLQLRAGAASVAADSPVHRANQRNRRRPRRSDPPLRGVLERRARPARRAAQSPVRQPAEAGGRRAGGQLPGGRVVGGNQRGLQTDARRRQGSGGQDRGLDGGGDRIVGVDPDGGGQCHGSDQGGGRVRRRPPAAGRG